jgi:hypothetical protein
MSRVRKDVAATLLTAAVVAVFAATHQGWDVWLVGDSRRWAAGVILALGAVSCALGSPEERRTTRLLAALGVVALASGAVALATASLTALSFLVAADVLLWAAATMRHVRQHPLTA